eukprot:Clim_evm18s22 gene=Clim_evmTU18s22
MVKKGTSSKVSKTSNKVKAQRNVEEEKSVDLIRWVNKQRVLVLASRGITHRPRHLVQDLRILMPHSKKESKMDKKDRLETINEITELRHCNKSLYFEMRRHSDLYMWISATPAGPSAKFLVENIHTMDEMKLTGNCLKGSRPLLVFDKVFDDEDHLKVLKAMFRQTFGTPKGHPKSKAFIDHIMLFTVADRRIWFRNYQIVQPDPTLGMDPNGEPTLAEIGPRFVLNPFRIFSGSFYGATLWENPHYISPTAMRRNLRQKRSTKYSTKVKGHLSRHERVSAIPEVRDALGDVFRE